MLKLTGLLFLLLFSVASGSAQVAINEILFMPDPAASDAIRTHQWVELFNAGTTPVDLTSWVITGGDGAQGASARPMPALLLPGGAYLVVHFATGTNQLDFTQGPGVYYTGDDPTVPVWNVASDEAGLYSPTGIVDFVAWATGAKQYQPAQAAADAVTAGIWTKGDFVQASFISRNAGEPGRAVAAGESLGRDGLSTDTNTSADFDAHGGVHASDITPGAQNAFQIPANPTAGAPAPQVRRGGAHDGALPQWTVLLYMATDNNLSGNGYRNMWTIGKALHDGGASGDVRYVVLADLQVAMGGAIAHTTLQGQIIDADGNGNPVFDAATFTQPAHQDMGDPQTMQNFLKWAQSTFPAQKYLLHIFTHGKGWKGIVQDYGSPGTRWPVDELYMGELKQALNGYKFDLITLESCLMAGIEVATQISANGNYLLASEEEILSPTFPYTGMVNTLHDNAAISGDALGSTLLDQWDGIYKASGANGQPQITRYTLAEIDLSKVDALAADVDKWALQLQAAVPLFQGRDDPLDNVQALLSNHAAKATRFADDNYMDLGHFANLVQKDADIPDGAKTAIPGLLKDLDGTAVKRFAHGPDVPDAHGLHIYFPVYRTYDALTPKTTALQQNVNGSPEPIQPYDRPLTRLVDGNSALAAYAPNLDAMPFQAQDEEDGTALAAPKDWPRKATPNFRWTGDLNNHWPAFLNRFYHPVADTHIVNAKQPDGKVIEPIQVGGGACANPIDSISVQTGSVIQLSGSGSSDADIPKTFLPPYYFWDLDYLSDCKDKQGVKCVAPDQVPDGSDAATNSNNNKDEDQEPLDTTIDDQDFSGAKTTWTCPSTLFNVVTLTVWDDNHTFPQHNTKPHASYVHPQTHSGKAFIYCDSGPSFTIRKPTYFYSQYVFPVAGQVLKPDGSPAFNMPVTVSPGGSTTSVAPVPAAGGGASPNVRASFAGPRALQPITVTTDSTGSFVVLVTSDSGPGQIALSTGGKSQTVSFSTATPNDGPPSGLQVHAPSSLTLNQTGSIGVSTVGQQGPVSQVTLLALTNNIQFTDNFVYGSGQGTQANTDVNGNAQVAVLVTGGGTAQILAMSGSTVKTVAIPITGGSAPADALQTNATLPVLNTGAPTSILFTLTAGGQPAASAKISVQLKQPTPGQGGLTFSPSPTPPTQTTLTTDSKGTATLTFTGTTNGLSVLNVTVAGTNLQRSIPVVVRLQ
jgi:hypothetical protein